MKRREGSSAAKLAALSLLYLTQGIPFGIASEYVPVLLREEHFTRTQIAVVSWLQLPWQLKVLWAHAGDHPRVRPHVRFVLCAIQLGLAATIALTGLGAGSRTLFFAAIGASAFFAATQDVFVDALAIRTLAPHERGWGNTAQVAGYRVGILAGGAGLLWLGSTAFGVGRAFTALAGIVTAVALTSFALRESTAAAESEADVPNRAPGTAIERTGEPPSPGPLALVRHILRTETWRVLAVSFFFKLGLHVLGGLLKPAMVDAHWTAQNIATIVTVATGAGLVGAAAGGLVHRAAGEPQALRIMCLAQFACTVPLVLALSRGMPLGLGQVAVAAEHFVSGAGTTVLFAALMTATRPSQASLHYTVLTSMNALGIGTAGLMGGIIADHYGAMAGFVLGAALCLLPLVFMRNWAALARTSAAEPAQP